jgi:hypothetical protein
MPSLGARAVSFRHWHFFVLSISSRQACCSLHFALKRQIPHLPILPAEQAQGSSVFSVDAALLSNMSSMNTSTVIAITVGTAVTGFLGTFLNLVEVPNTTR